MEISVEISMYPLTEDYLTYVKDFIERLQRTENISVVGNTISTQVFGDYEVVMDVLKKEIKASWDEFGRSIFVCKFLGRNLDPVLNPHG